MAGSGGLHTWHRERPTVPPEPTLWDSCRQLITVPPAEKSRPALPACPRQSPGDATVTPPGGQGWDASVVTVRFPLHKLDLKWGVGSVVTQTCPSGELMPDGGAEAPREHAAGRGRCRVPWAPGCRDPPVPAVLSRATCLAAGAPSPVPRPPSGWWSPHSAVAAGGVPRLLRKSACLPPPGQGRPGRGESSVGLGVSSLSHR